ncbi:hypothetical protein [Amycolatopsis sp. NPDC058986]|uniref:hypothetical protein n=1 Tax=unclassified Amycolatopsis TaxID=2618356 RepID=UPI00366D3827
MSPLIITMIASLAFACCLLRWAIRRRRLQESAYAGSHRRAPSQPPSSTLRYAIATAGTHGLGMRRGGSGK